MELMSYVHIISPWGDFDFGLLLPYLNINTIIIIKRIKATHKAILIIAIFFHFAWDFVPESSITSSPSSFKVYLSYIFY